MKSWAEALYQAQVHRTPMTPISSSLSAFSLENGYAVQSEGLRNRLARGEQLAGYKMGLTSIAKQRDVNVHAPIRGYLLRSHEVKLGDPILTENRIHPRVEPEVGVVVGRTITAEQSLAEIRQRLSGAFLAVEILDSRFEAFQFKLPDVVADNTSASGYVLGTVDVLDRWDEVRLAGVIVRKNGQIVETGSPAAVLGNPLVSVRELAKALAAENRVLEPGMVVLTGGITASLTVKSNDVIEFEWPWERLVLKAK